MKNTTNLGNIGQAYVIAKFVELGIPVYTPVGEGYPTDLIADFKGKLNKIQIKTTENLHDNYMVWKITHQQGYHGKRTKYTNQEVDYFDLYCIETKGLYLVPYEKATTNDLIIRLDSYKGTRIKTMKFESDYRFENFVY